jgi:uncharacterized membrane protein YhaH (DUF805 family)
VSAVSFGEAIRSGFDHYVKFDGRASRSAFWWWALFQAIVAIVALIVDYAIFNSPGVFYGLTALGLLLPSFSVAIRRLHDTDRSGWWLLIYLVPLIGAIVLLVFFLTGSDPGANRYGPGPDASQAGAAAVPPPPPPPAASS